MEKLPLNQKESGINRIVGFENEKEKELLEYFRGVFENNGRNSKEKEKTPEQLEMIERINSGMKDFLSQYSIEAIEIPSENVHVLDKTKFTEPELKKFQEQVGTEYGFYSGLEQSMVIMKDYEESKLSFIQTLVHEMLHLQGFYSYQKSSPETADITLRKMNELASMNIRRSGFSIGTANGKRLLFHKLNESVITELAIRFEKNHMTRWPELEGELKIRDEIVRQIADREHISTEEVGQTIAGIKGSESTGYKYVTYTYHEERKRFNFLIDELYNRNKDSFESREQVFILFATATLTGRLLSIARLIEKTFGKGSFKMLGEASSNKPTK